MRGKEGNMKIKNKCKDIVYITGDRKDIVLENGDKVDLKFVVNFEIEVIKDGVKREIVVKEVKINREETIVKDTEIYI